MVWTRPSSHPNFEMLTSWSTAVSSVFCLVSLPRKANFPHSGLQMMNLTLVDFGKVTLAGIEPAIFWLCIWCSTHWAKVSVKLWTHFKVSRLQPRWFELAHQWSMQQLWNCNFLILHYYLPLNNFLTAFRMVEWCYQISIKLKSRVYFVDVCDPKRKCISILCL